MTKWKVLGIFSVNVIIRPPRTSIKPFYLLIRAKIEIILVLAQSGHYESLAVHLVVERRVQADV